MGKKGKKVVKLESVLKLLRDKAKEANDKAAKCIGYDNETDAYYQGPRNGFLQSEKALKENKDKLA